MQLAERDGIACDECGMTHKSDFTYYSLDFYQVNVTDNRSPSLDTILSSQIVFSLDFCAQCVHKLQNTVVQNYNKSMSKARTIRVGHLCELSGQRLTGSYTYYYCVIAKVVVKTSGQPYVCLKCQAKALQPGKCGKCGNLQAIRPAAVTIDKRYLEVTISEPIYKTMIAQAGRVRKVAGEWITRT